MGACALDALLVGVHVGAGAGGECRHHPITTPSLAILLKLACVLTLFQQISERLNRCPILEKLGSLCLLLVVHVTHHSLDVGELLA